MGEQYYTKRCEMCGQDLSLIHFHRAHVNRVCTRCFSAWLGQPLDVTSRVMAIHTLKLYHKLEVQNG